jgi:hypothetical protein
LTGLLEHIDHHLDISTADNYNRDSIEGMWKDVPIIIRRVTARHIPWNPKTQSCEAPRWKTDVTVILDGEVVTTWGIINKDNEVLCANWFSERCLERDEVATARRKELKTLWKP